MEKTLLDTFLIWGIPVLILATGIFVGWLFKKIIHHKLKNLTQKTRWKGDDIALKAVESQILPWIALAALYVAFKSLEIVEPFKTYIARFILIAVILSITFAVKNLLVGALDEWSKKQGRGFPSTKIFTNLIKIVIIIIGILIVLESLNISITPMLTALGIGGLAISLALKDTLSDLFSGLHILLSKKVKPGDFVEIDGGTRGYITNITWRNTTLLERANNVISIPNSRISAAIVKNYDIEDASFSVRIPIGVSYSSNLDNVEKITHEVALAVQKEIAGAVEGFDPIVRFFEFGDSSINLKVYFQAKQYGDHHALKHEFIKRLHNRYEAEGIVIPFPIRTIIHENNSNDL
jgi:small-conductance mechanosensitive channel